MELRTNLVKTVFESWIKTGFAWEQYNPDTGRGQRTQHFTGWTSLIVKIIAMPDLQQGSQAQVALNQHGPVEIDHLNMKLGLGVTAMLLLCFVFRRRLSRFWRNLMES